MDLGVDLPDGAFNLRVPGMAYQHQHLAARDVALALDMNLGNEGAGGIEHRQPPLGGFIHDGAGDTMGAEDSDGAIWDFGERLDEDRPLPLQLFHDMAIVHDFVTDIDRRPKLDERLLDNLNGPHDASAEAAGLCQKNLHAGQFSVIASYRQDRVVSAGSKRRSRTMTSRSKR
jgi:hypothetical protein